MKTIFVFALIFLAFTANAEVNLKRAAHIQKHIYALVQTGYTVDTVLQLLNALLNVQQANLDELEANWEVTKAALEDNIAAIQGLDDAQHQHCADIEGTITDLKTEILRYVDYIHQAQDVLQTNADNLASKLDARCSGNLLYVQHLKSNQDAERLLEFLRGQVANPGFKDYLENNNEAFVELHHHVSNKKRATLSMLAKHHMMAMIQQAYTGESDLGFTLESRSDSEIGTGHIDNDQSAVTVDAFTIDARNLDNFISELLGFIDDLIDEIDSDTEALQKAEFAAVEDLIDYEDQIEADAVVLNRYITLWVGHIQDLQATIEQDEDALADCEVRAEELDEQLENAEEDYAERTEAFEDRQASLEHTVAALQECIDVYTNTVANAAIEYKQRFDDEMDEMAADRARARAEQEEEERAEIESQENRDRVGAAAAAAATESSSSEGPVTEWISNQEQHEAEEALAAELASSSSEEEEEETEESVEETSESTESLITVAESSSTFATIETPVTEWAAPETYGSTVSVSVEESLPSVHWSAAPATYSESTWTAVSIPSVPSSVTEVPASWVSEETVEESSESTVEAPVESESTETAWAPESEEEETEFNPETWTFQEVVESSESSTASETAAWEAAVSAAAPTVEVEEPSTLSATAQFSAAVAEASVSEEFYIPGAAAPSESESESETAAAGNAWSWNAETSTETNAETESVSSTEGAFVQRRGNLRRRF